MEQETALGERLATADEIRAAIEALTSTELMRLELIARTYIPGSDYQSGQEVLNEAVKRAIEGCGRKTGRHWPIDRVDFAAFLLMTMRGLASDSRQSELMTKTDSLDSDAQLSTAQVLDKLGFHTPEVEQQKIDLEDEIADEAAAEQRRARAKADADKIEGFFADDQEVAWLVLCLKIEKMPSKARDEAGLSQTQYETVRRRMRRGLTKLFPGRSTK